MDEHEQKAYDNSMLIATQLMDKKEIEINDLAAVNIILKSEIFRKLCQINKHLEDGIKFDANAPVNAYGEGLVDGIQNAIERGQRGISTYR